MNARVLPTALVVFGVLAAVGLVLAPSFVSLHALWTDTEGRAYTHGYLVLATCLWLVWRKLPRVSAAGIAPQPLLAVAVLLAAGLWAVAWRAGIQDVFLLLLPVVAWLALATVLGRRAAMPLLLPVMFLVFALPLWSSGNDILQAITVQVTRLLIWITGISAYVQGDLVQVPAGVFEIADGCSGLHFFVVGLTVAALYGEIGDDPPRARLEWLVLAAVLSLLANWIRVFTIIVAGYVTDMQHYLVRVDHYTFGWVVFAVALVVFFWIAHRRAARYSANGASAPASDAADALVVSRRAQWVAAASALLCLAVLPLMARHAAASIPVATQDLLAWPPSPAATTNDIIPGFTPNYPGASAHGIRSYRSGDADVGMFQAVYLQQRQGAELVGGDTTLTDARAIVESSREVQGASGVWRETIVHMPSGPRVLVRARWLIGARAFSTPRASQLWYGMAALGRPVPSRIVAMATRCASENCDAAERSLDDMDRRLGAVEGT